MWVASSETAVSLHAALLDRLLHRCAVIPNEGESYWMRGYLEQASALRKGV